MPTSSPHRLPHDPAIRARRPARARSRIALLTLAACILLAAASAQTLAHPGLVGNGMTNDPWWQHAVFYQVDPPRASPYTDFKDLSTRLDALRSLSVDALIVPAPALPARPAANSPAAPNPAFDTALEELDTLVRQASQRSLRVLVTIRPAPTDDLISIARFWLSRGVAGFRFIPPAGATPPENQASIQLLRRLTATVVGQRIVLAAFDPNAPAGSVPAQSTNQPATQTTSRGIYNARRTTHSSDTAPELQVDSQLSRISLPTAANLRPLLAQNLAQPALVLDIPHSASAATPDPNSALAYINAAILLTTHSASLIDPGQSLFLNPDTPPVSEGAKPAPPRATAPSTSTFTLVGPTTPAPNAHPPKPLDPQLQAAAELTDWYRQLSVLHHGNATLRFGATTLLNFDQQNALGWVAQSAKVSTLAPPVVVLCNLSSVSVQLPVGAALRTMNLRGSYLRTLLRSDKAMGPQNLDAVTLPPFSVYIGELRR